MMRHRGRLTRKEDALPAKLDDSQKYFHHLRYESLAALPCEAVRGFLS